MVCGGFESGESNSADRPASLVETTSAGTSRTIATEKMNRKNIAAGRPRHAIGMSLIGGGEVGVNTAAFMEVMMRNKPNPKVPVVRGCASIACAK